jgi:glycosyltransferase involved in cell wall biosynthesis
MIKVLMISRSTLRTSVGGDTVQILETAAFLRRLGVDVDVKLSNEAIDYSKYDLVHFFNIIRPADILKHIEICKLPFVISTVFVDYEESEKRTRKGLVRIINNLLSADRIEYLKAITRWIINGEKIGSSKYLLWGHKKSIKYILRNSAYLLPNSESEYQRLFNKYRIKQKYSVIPNAINIENFVPDGMDRDREGVICVGRIEAVKNQLSLIRALNKTDYKGYIVGDPSANAKDYYLQCQKEAGDNITFINHMPQKQLAELYLKCKVHVLPSWFETTGLSSLEAGVLGCNVVVSPKGDTREYFKDFAWYCDPSSVASIKEAIQNAYAQENDGRLQNYILDNYTWDKTAEKTLLVYKKVLNIE